MPGTRPMCHGGRMRVTGVDACRRGWVAVSLYAPGGARGGRPPRNQQSTERAGMAARLQVEAIGVHQDLTDALDGTEARVVGIDMPLGLLKSGWREADRAARGLLGPRRSSVFAIPPRAVWEQASYQAASQRCRELTGQGLSIQAWGLRA
ncbi:MAG TPA: DUF429 domain-containing protein, partial [Streptosporangiaceae bacterium]|nr:DUF429 domain-containing protein [Streptosporangiaceae bacterium]